jgi:superfamily II DNA or RNA helicase
MSVKIIVKHDISQVVTADTTVKDMLCTCLKFRERNYFHNRLYKQKIWDGFTSFFNKDSGKFLTGLLPEILMALKLKNIDYEIDDIRDKFDFIIKEIDENFLNQWLPEGIDKIKLEDYQVDFTNQAVKHQRGIVFAPTSSGKAQPYNSLIATQNGFVKLKDLKLKDKVCVPNGGYAELRGIFPQGKKKIVQITFNNGDVVECCENHLWKVKINKETKVVEAKDLINEKNKVFVPVPKRVDFLEKQTKTEPYFFGLIISNVINYEKNKLAKETIIPDEYLFNSYDNRIKLLCGLLDGRSLFGKRSIYYVSYSKTLNEQIKQLVQSLGGITYTKLKIRKNRMIFLTGIILPKEIIPFLDIEKAKTYKSLSYFKPIRYIDKIEYTEKKDCACISVDHPDQLYLTNNFVVTHNTFILTSIIKCLPPNTPILVVQNRKSLAIQNYNELIKWGFKNVGRLYHTYNQPNLITVATVQSCSKIAKLLPKFKVLIVDEIHDMMSKTPKAVYKKMINCGIRIGLSATPFKYGETDKVQKYYVKGFFGPILKTTATESGLLTTKELQDRGRLSKSSCFFIKIKGEKLEHVIYQDAVQHGIVENHYFHDMVENLANKCIGRTLILVDRIQHGDILKYRLPNAFWVKGEDNNETRQEVIDQLQKAQGNVIAIATQQIFNTGINVFLHNLVNSCGGSADHLIIQRMGRGLRVAKDKNGLNYYDFLFENNEYLEKHSEKRISILEKQGHKIKILDSIEDLKF